MRVVASQGEVGDMHNRVTENDGKTVQQGRSKRKAEAYFGPYVEALSDARTQLEGFYNILSLRGVEPCVIQTRQGEGEGLVPLPPFTIWRGYGHRAWKRP